MALNSKYFKNSSFIIIYNARIKQFLQKVNQTSNIVSENWFD
jgi:hypothetical protein